MRTTEPPDDLPGDLLERVARRLAGYVFDDGSGWRRNREGYIDAYWPAAVSASRELIREILSTSADAPDACCDRKSSGVGEPTFHSRAELSEAIEEAIGLVSAASREGAPYEVAALRGAHERTARAATAVVGVFEKHFALGCATKGAESQGG